MTRTGTVRRFVGDRSMVVLGLVRGDGVYVVLPVEPREAAALVLRYGVVMREGIDMSALVGKNVEYTESDTGMVVRLDVLAAPRAR